MKLSVCIITYNQEDFIGQAIESALMQETSFPFEIVIGEDASTDKTGTIVASYQKKYPDKIRLTSHKENQGAVKNFLSTLDACKGEFIAILEGDDFWTEKTKLQKQVDFLEENKDFSACFHGVKNILNSGELVEIAPVEAYREPELDTKKLIIRSNYIPTCSLVFRKASLSMPASLTISRYILDWQINLMLLTKGRVKYLPMIWASYRVSSGGAAFSNLPTPEKIKESIVIHQTLDDYYKKKYHSIFVSHIANSYAQMAIYYLKNGQLSDGYKMLGEFYRRPMIKEHAGLSKKLIQYPLWTAMFTTEHKFPRAYKVIRKMKNLVTSS